MASPPSSPQTGHPDPIALAQQHLQGLIQHYQTLAQGETGETLTRATYQEQMDRLGPWVHKLERRIFTIAAFGLVSRGKSAVLNGLLGQKLLQTGPLHGVTRWPRTVPWPGAWEQLGEFLPPDDRPPTPPRLQVELIDTPGLDEIDGQAQTTMAQQVAQQADLILFVAVGKLNPLEYEALTQLLAFGKPLILVFNKVDLSPPPDWSEVITPTLTLARGDLVPVAAEPTPIQVRIESAQGDITQSWESPPPQMQALHQRLAQVIHQEGETLLALNGLGQGQQAEQTVGDRRFNLRSGAGDRLLDRVALGKGAIVALCPWIGLDLLAGAMADLVAVRNLARLYELPMTSHGVGTLWRQWLISGGLLLLVDSSSQSLGIGLGSEGGMTLGATLAQGLIAGGVALYGCYRVGRSAQHYLRSGATWGPRGSSTLIQLFNEKF